MKNAILISFIGICMSMLNPCYSINADSYEPNNTENTAFSLPVTFTNGTTYFKTTSASINNYTDYDYYKVIIPASVTILRVSSRLQDSYSHTDNLTYTIDARISYKVNNGSWSYTSDTQNSDFDITGGDVIFFKVETYSTASSGTYNLDLTFKSDVPSLSVSNSNIKIGSSSETFKVLSNVTWLINDNYTDWLTFSPTSGTKTENITVTATKNTTGYTRSANISILGNGINSSKYIYITQAMEPIAEDEYENNDSLNTATTILFNDTCGVLKSKTISAKISRHNDIDYYKIELPKDNKTYSISPEFFGEDADGNYFLNTNLSYKIGNNTWNSSYSSYISVSGSSTVYLKVETSNWGKVGNYEFKTSIIKGTPSLTTSSSNIVAISTANTNTISINSNTSWYISSIPDWITVSPMNGTGSGTITITAKQNPNSSIRNSYFYIYGTGLYSNYISINQAGMIFNPDSYENNNTENTATTIPLNFNDNIGTAKTSGANFNNLTDIDYYKIVIPNDSDYYYISLQFPTIDEFGNKLSITPQYSYKINSGEWSTYLSSNTSVPKNSIIYLKLNPSYSNYGTYQFIFTALNEVPKLTISDDYIEFIPNVSSLTINIQSNTNWSISNNYDWLEISPSQGSKDGIITITPKKYISSSTRSANLYIYGTGTYSKYISIYQYGTNASYLFVASQTISINSSSTTLSIPVTSNGTWKITNSPAWVSIISATETQNDGVIQVLVDENLSTYSRYGYINISNGSTYKKIEIYQERAIPTLKLDIDTINFDIQGGEKTISITTNGNWNCYEYNNWITIDKTNGSGNSTINLTVSDNTNGNERSGYITFSVYGGSSSIILFIQQNGAVLDPDKYENNNTELLSSNLKFTYSDDIGKSEIIEANIHNSTDVDYYKFTTPEGNDEYSIIATVFSNFSNNIYNTNYSLNDQTIEYKTEFGYWQNYSSSFKTNSNKKVYFRIKSNNGIGTYAFDIKTYKNITNSISLKNKDGFALFMQRDTTASITIISNTNWNAESNVSWLTLSNPNGSNTGSLKINISRNNSTEYRYAIITINGKSALPIQLIVVQLGEPILTTSVKEIMFSSQSSSSNYKVQASRGWEIVSNLYWVNTSQVQNNNNNKTFDGTVNVIVDENMSSETRSLDQKIYLLDFDLINFNAYKKIAEVQVKITQTGVGAAKVLSVDKNEFSFSTNENKTSFNILSNTSWKVESNANWLTIAKKSGNNSSEINFTCTENKDSMNRNAIISVVVEGFGNQSVHISQNGNSKQVLPSTIQKIVSKSLSIFPNPSNGIFNIQFTDEKLLGTLNLKIQSMKGITVYNEIFNINHPQTIKEINCNLPKGIYILSMESLQSIRSTVLIIK